MWMVFKTILNAE